MSEVPKNEATLHANRFEEMFLHALSVFLKNKLLLYVVYGVILSYFYNLAVINYSITGDNEFRLYDVLGGIILYNYYKYRMLINVVIRKVPFFKILKKFMLWASITMVLTLIFHVINDKILSFFTSSLIHVSFLGVLSCRRFFLYFLFG